MAKIRKRIGTVRNARKPTWIEDQENQRKWNRKFISILERDYEHLDPAIATILRNERLSQICATKIRGYVDKECTNWWYKESKSRGAQRKRELEQAVAGLNIAFGLYSERGDRATSQYLGMRAIDLLAEISRCKQAFGTKPHGRDRDHSFLFECRSFLRTKLGQPTTYKTLANLVNAGYEADGSPLKELITEEQIRKNLANFKRNNPLWHLYGSLQ